MPRARARVAVRVTAAALLAPLLLAVGAPGAPAAVAPPPPNDHIAGATVVPGLPFTDTADTTGATTDPSDPTSCFGNNQTVWYRLTPSSTVDVRADTFGSNYDTTLSIWTGPPGALTQVACNDDFDSLQSRVSFTATAGIRYWLMVGSFFPDDAEHALVLTMAALPPRLDLRVTIRPTGTVDAAGVATVGGTVSCSRPVDLTVVGSVRQRWRNPPAVGWFSVSLACSGFRRWTGSTPGETNSFAPGGARVGATASGFDELRAEPVRRFVARTVTLARA